MLLRKGKVVTASWVDDEENDVTDLLTVAMASPAGPFDGDAVPLVAPVKLTTKQYEGTIQALLRSATVAYDNRARMTYTEGSLRWSGITDQRRSVDGQYPSYADCLAAGTRVLLARGDTPIEDVRVGDLALTRKGWRPVTAAWRARENADVVTVALPDGRSIVGTPAHRVWTENDGWKLLANLETGDILLGCNQNLSKSSNMAEIDSADIPHHPTEINAFTTTQGSLDTFIASFGSKRTAPSQMGTKSTTLAMSLTTRSKTLRALSSPNIVECQLTLAYHDHINALTAELDLSRFHQGLLGSADFAVRDARKHLLENLGDTLRSECAKNVNFPSRQINTDQRDSVQINALRLADSAQAMGRSDVYDLTVAGESEFFANGVLVHNCSAFVTWCYWDATRWLDLPDILNEDGWLGGYTGTLTLHGSHIEVGDTVPGDICLYGGTEWVPQHATMTIGGGRVISFGHQGDPGVYPINLNGELPIVGIRRYLTKG